MSLILFPIWIVVNDINFGSDKVIQWVLRQLFPEPPVVAFRRPKALRMHWSQLRYLELHRRSASVNHVVTNVASAVPNCNTHKCSIARRQEREQGEPVCWFFVFFAFCFFLYMFFYKRMHIISGLTIVYRHHGEDVAPLESNYGWLEFFP
jgi:hypothetical protein